MRGSIVKRSKTSWALVVDQGRDATGKRRQKWVTFLVPRNVSQREAHKQADAKLAELLHQIDKGTFVDATKTTLVEYLRDWHKTNVVPHRRPETARIYLSIIETARGDRAHRDTCRSRRSARATWSVCMRR